MPPTPLPRISEVTLDLLSVVVPLVHLKSLELIFAAILKQRSFRRNKQSRLDTIPVAQDFGEQSDEETNKIARKAGRRDMLLKALLCIKRALEEGWQSTGLKALQDTPRAYSVQYVSKRPNCHKTPTRREPQAQ